MPICPWVRLLTLAECECVQMQKITKLQQKKTTLKV